MYIFHMYTCSVYISIFFCFELIFFGLSLYKSVKSLVAVKSNYLSRLVKPFFFFLKDHRLKDLALRLRFFLSLISPYFLSARRQTTSCLKQTRLLLARLVPRGIRPGGLITRRLGVPNNSNEKLHCPRAFVDDEISKAIIRWA